MTITLARAARAPATAMVEVRNPFDGSLVGRVRQADEIAVAEALRQARKAWSSFRFSTPAERKDLLHRLAARLGEEAEAMARIICAEVGKTIAEARNEVRRAGNTLRLSGDAVAHPLGNVA